MPYMTGMVSDVQNPLFLRKFNTTPFAQPYRDFKNNVSPSIEQRRFARWVNHKAIFNTVEWNEYT